MKLSVYHTGILFFIVILFSCTKPQSESLERPLRIGLNRTVKSVPVVIADELGSFTRVSVPVDLHLEPTVTGLMQQLQDRELDMVCIPDFLAVQNALDWDDFRIIAVLNRNQSRVLMIHQDVGSSVTDLRNKKVGLAINSASEYTLHRLLLANRNSLADVHIVYFHPRDLPRALASGQVDAIIAMPPLTSDASDLMDGRVTAINAHAGRDMYWLLLAHKDWIEKYPVATVNFLKALDSSYTLINRKPDEARRITARRLSLPLELIATEWPDYRFELELPGILLTVLEQEASWRIRYYNLDRAIPDFNELIKSGYMHSAFPKRSGF